MGLVVDSILISAIILLIALFFIRKKINKEKIVYGEQQVKSPDEYDPSTDFAEGKSATEDLPSENSTEGVNEGEGDVQADTSGNDGKDEPNDSDGYAENGEGDESDSSSVPDVKQDDGEEPESEEQDEPEEVEDDSDEKLE